MTTGDSGGNFTVNGCPAPSLPNNTQQMERAPDDVWLNGSHVVYRCMTGYVHKSGALNRTCLGGGMWSGESPLCVIKPVLSGEHIAWIIIGVVGLVVLLLFGQDFIRYRNRKSQNRKNRTSVPRDHPRPLPFHKYKFDNPFAVPYAADENLQKAALTKRHKAYMTGNCDAQNGIVPNVHQNPIRRIDTKKKRIKTQQVGPSDTENDSPVKVAPKKNKRSRKTHEDKLDHMDMSLSNGCRGAPSEDEILLSKKLATDLAPMNNTGSYHYDSGDALTEIPIRRSRPEFVFPAPTEDIVYTIPVARSPSPRNPLPSVRSLPMDGQSYAIMDDLYKSELV